jgi:hypothetical protein
MPDGSARPGDGRDPVGPGAACRRERCVAGQDESEQRCDPLSVAPFVSVDAVVGCAIDVAGVFSAFSVAASR